MYIVLYTLIGLSLVNAASANELVYTPVNPSFGGSPLNSTQLLSEASAQKPSAPAAKVTALQYNSSQQFLQLLQSRLYSSLAESVSTAITGQSAQDAGKIKLDNLEVSWTTNNGQTQINLNDFRTGQITQISVPKVTQ